MLIPRRQLILPNAIRSARREIFRPSARPRALANRFLLMGGGDNRVAGGGGGGGGGTTLAFTGSINPATWNNYNATAYASHTFTSVPISVGYQVIFVFTDATLGIPVFGVFHGTTPMTCLGYAGQSTAINVEAWGWPVSSAGNVNITATFNGALCNYIALAGGYITGSSNIHVKDTVGQNRTYVDDVFPAITMATGGVLLVGAQTTIGADPTVSWGSGMSSVYSYWNASEFAETNLGIGTAFGTPVTPELTGMAGDRYTGALALALHGDAPTTPASGWNQMLRGAPYTHDGTSAGWGGYTLRLFIPAGMQQVTGSQIRPIIKSPGGNNMVISKAYIQKAAKTAGANLYAFSTTPVQLLSSGAAGVTVAAGATHTFDAATLAITRMDDLVMSIHFTTAANILNRSGFVYGPYRTYYKSGDDAATVAAVDYSGDSGSNDLPFVLTGIEALT